MQREMTAVRGIKSIGRIRCCSITKNPEQGIESECRCTFSNRAGWDVMESHYYLAVTFRNQAISPRYRRKIAERVNRVEMSATDGGVVRGENLIRVSSSNGIEGIPIEIGGLRADVITLSTTERAEI